MLVIGDLNSQRLCYNAYNVRMNEYICEDYEDIQNNLEKFNLNKENLISSNNTTYTYKNEKKVFSFHDSSKYLLIHSIYRLCGGSTVKDRYASILGEWSICKARLKFVHDDVESWCNRIETYLELSERMKHFDNHMLNLVKSNSTGLSGWVINNHGIQKNIYKFKPFVKYDKKKIYQLITNGDSKYMQLMLNESNFNDREYVMDHMFNSRLSYDEKLQAVLEKLYVETINEYILPELEKFNKLPDDIFECFLKVYMNMSSLYSSHSFINFAINNYYDVIDKYNEMILDTVFYDAYKNKKI